MFHKKKMIKKQACLCLPLHVTHVTHFVTACHLFDSSKLSYERLLHSPTTPHSPKTCNRLLYCILKIVQHLYCLVKKAPQKAGPKKRQKRRQKWQQKGGQKRQSKKGGKKAARKTVQKFIPVPVLLLS